MTETGRLLIFMGIALAAAGGFLLYTQKTGQQSFFHWWGNLPLDFKIEKENFHFYFPLGTSVTVSVLISIVLYCFHKFIH